MSTKESIISGAVEGVVGKCIDVPIDGVKAYFVISELLRSLIDQRRGTQLCLLENLSVHFAFADGSDYRCIMLNGDTHIGRNPKKNHIAIDGDTTISREHIVISYAPDNSFLLKVVHSHGPDEPCNTYVNEKAYYSGDLVPIKNGDVIRLGNQLFVFTVDYVESIDELKKELENGIVDLPTSGLGGDCE